MNITSNVTGLVAILLILVVVILTFQNASVDFEKKDLNAAFAAMEELVTYTCDISANLQSYNLEISKINAEYEIYNNDKEELCLRQGEEVLGCRRFDCEVSSNEIILQNGEGTDGGYNCQILKLDDGAVNISCTDTFNQFAGQGAYLSPEVLDYTSRAVVSNSENVQIVEHADASLEIPAGTEITFPNGQTSASLSVTRSPAPNGGDFLFVGEVYDFGPDGTQFAAPGAKLSFKYSDAEVVDEDNLVIKYYENGEWVSLETTVDKVNNIASAYVLHFTDFSAGEEITFEWKKSQFCNGGTLSTTYNCVDKKTQSEIDRQKCIDVYGDRKSSNAAGACHTSARWVCAYSNSGNTPSYFCLDENNKIVSDTFCETLSKGFCTEHQDFQWGCAEDGKSVACLEKGTGRLGEDKFCNPSSKPSVESVCGSSAIEDDPDFYWMCAAPDYTPYCINKSATTTSGRFVDNSYCLAIEDVPDECSASTEDDSYWEECMEPYGELDESLCIKDVGENEWELDMTGTACAGKPVPEGCVGVGDDSGIPILEPDPEECTKTSDKICSNNNLYYKDTCGEATTEVAGYCDTSAGCEDGRSKCNYGVTYSKDYKQLWGCCACGYTCTAEEKEAQPKSLTCVSPSLDTTYNCKAGYTAEPAPGTGYYSQGRYFKAMIKSEAVGHGGGNCETGTPSTDTYTYHWLCVPDE